MKIVNLEVKDFLIGTDIKWKVEQLQESVSYHIECWDLVNNPEVKRDLEIKIKELKNKIRKIISDNE